jgi:hypothetical protein
MNKFNNKCIFLLTEIAQIYNAFEYSDIYSHEGDTEELKKLLYSYDELKYEVEEDDEELIKLVELIKENLVKKEVFYEINHTIESGDFEELKSSPSDDFKLIEIELPNSSNQKMTKFKDRYDGTKSEFLEIIKEKLLKDIYLISSKGYNVIRSKVELMPHNNILRFSNNIKYFEAHFKLRLQNSEVSSFDEIIKSSSLNIHKSKSKYKVLNDQEFIQILTIRESSGSDYNDLLTKTLYLIKDNFELMDYEEELCIIDTNEDLDKQWLNS